MLDETQQQALCERLSSEFGPIASAISDRNDWFPPPAKFVTRSPLPEQTEIKREIREWGSVRWTGFKPWINIEDPDDWGFAGQIVGQRSDGQFFYVVMVWRPHIEEGTPEQTEQLLRSKFENAILTFKSFRDCSCGIIGNRDTGDTDDEGFPITVPIHSPCPVHPLAAGNIDETLRRIEEVSNDDRN